MIHPSATSLAVARLEPTAQGGQPVSPVHGECLLYEAGPDVSMTIAVKSSEPTLPLDGTLFYTTTLVATNAQLDLAVFRAATGNKGYCTCLLPVALFQPGEAIRIRLRATASGGNPGQPPPILEGPLVWLTPTESQSAKSQSVESQPVESQSADSQPVESQSADSQPVESQSVESPETDLNEGEALAAETVRPMALASETPTAGDQLAENEAEPSASGIDDTPSELEAADTSGEPDTIGFKLCPEPAVPASTALEPQPVVLANTHPLVTRANGTALIDRSRQSLTVTIRGLPNPGGLGIAQLTGRPYNAYRVWLTFRRTGSRWPLGLCTRHWGDNYRFQSEAPLPLAEYDTVIVTAVDRHEAVPYHGGPQVLAGEY